MTQLAWSAQQYLKFEDERTRPARDLLARVPLDQATCVIDLGCGPGNSTELLVERFGAKAVRGLDSDDDMLAKARARLPEIPFIKADLATWRPEAPVDLLYANAVFQWLPDHLDLLATLMEHLSPGGVLAVQMPDNLGEPSHLAMEQTGAEGPWAPAFAGGRIRRARLPAPANYLQRLQGLSSRVDVWHTIYYHPMADAKAIVDWVEGTGLRPYLAAVAPDAREAFRDAYLKRIDAAYPPMADGRRLLAFPRLFVVAVKG
ncbi:trans-aconitate methyltransferase [Rhizobium sp. Root274]|uniref:trans-aconitate 2-methyltransferase n=1 Tax=unclassified Rhizobium TaxID=2613769 RepID=UPI000712AC41|nr:MULTISPECIES: trans-aconitate 2-methyltransferase [unclassified Rhizobium]KQW31240.1 trans-aconitate methyltransferase [Rhizobium sp. Root1240]KRD32785.1 trans-aconitate methyltransferase [Rhizobium sp. Root274]